MKRKICVLITAGPTREYIDPVRFISNASSGKMGYFLADFIRKDKDTKVILVSGPTALVPPENTKTISINSARQMYNQVLKYYKKSDILIFTAAVSDWRLKKFSLHKLKKGNKYIDLKLFPNPDISLEISKKICAEHTQEKVLVGFALETRDLVKNAIKKLKTKRLDLIVADTVISMGTDIIEGYIIDQTKRIEKINKMDKIKFVKLLWARIKKIYYSKM